MVLGQIEVFCCEFVDDGVEFYYCGVDAVVDECCWGGAYAETTVEYMC